MNGRRARRAPPLTPPESHANVDAGEVSFVELELCSMTMRKQADEYYHVFGSGELGGVDET